MCSLNNPRVGNLTLRPRRQVIVPISNGNLLQDQAEPDLYRNLRSSPCRKKEPRSAGKVKPHDWLRQHGAGLMSDPNADALWIDQESVWGMLIASQREL
jgi:hypothetical protein